MSLLFCSVCQGSGQKFGVHDALECESCEGSGNQRCQSRGCKEPAVGFTEDGDALCEDCLMEWVERGLWDA